VERKGEKEDESGVYLLTPNVSREDGAEGQNRTFDTSLLRASEN